MFNFSIIGNTNSLNLRVKISSPDGLLLWTGGSLSAPSSDYLMLGVRHGFLEFRFNLGNGEGVLVYNATKIDDSKWHRIRATRFDMLYGNCCINTSYKYRNIYSLFRQSSTDFSLFLLPSRSFHSLPLTSISISFWPYHT